MTIRLRDEFEKLTAAVGDQSDAERAIAAARGRRKRNGFVGAVSLAAVGATVLAIGLNWPPVGETAPPAGIDQTTAPQAVFRDWVPQPLTVGAPAPAGTMMLRSCAAADCSVKLLKSDKSTIDLADLRPELAQLIAANGLEGASLSPDAEWLGLRNGGGFDIYNLADSAKVYKLEAGAAESQWRVIGWNNNVTLVNVRQGRPLDYAVIDLTTGAKNKYQPPSGSQKLPVGVGGVGGDLALAQPIDVRVPISQRARVTKIAVSSLVIVPNPAESQSQGEQDGGQNTETDFTTFLQPGETLAGPAGVPITSTVLDPKGEMSDEVLTTVFAPSGDALVPVAVVRPDARQRFNVPASSTATTWSFLVVLSTDGIAVRRSNDGEPTADIVWVGVGDKQSVLQTVPKDAQVLLPGMG